MGRYIAALALIVLLVVFFVYVWPTRYWYTTVRVPVTFPYAMLYEASARVDRFRGNVDVLVSTRIGGPGLMDATWYWKPLPTDSGDPFEEGMMRAEATMTAAFKTRTPLAGN